MTILIVLLSLMAVAWSAAIPESDPKHKQTPDSHSEGRRGKFIIIPIRSQSQDVGLDGNFAWGFEADNGITHQQRAISKPVGPEEIEQVIEGEYKYTSPEGESVFAKYIADKLGFRIIEASHVPTPPPIPAAIMRSLQYNFEHPEGDTHKEKKAYRQETVLKV